MPQLRLFDNVEDLLQRAYDTQGQRIAYIRDEKTGGEEQEIDGE